MRHEVFREIIGRGRGGMEGNIGKDGYPSGLSSESKIQEVAFGQGDKQFESKEF